MANKIYLRDGGLSSGSVPPGYTVLGSDNGELKKRVAGTISSVGSSVSSLSVEVNNNLITGPETNTINFSNVRANFQFGNPVNNIIGTIQNPTNSSIYIETGISVNGYSPFDGIQIGPSSLVDVVPFVGATGIPNIATITLKPEISYKSYRSKLTAAEIDWPGYGYLYNWYAVTDARLINNPSGGTGLTTPNEWRVPSVTDWTTLTTFAGGSASVGAGGKLKSTLTYTSYPFYGWLNNGGGTDDYNFSALPGSLRDESGYFPSAFNNLIGVIGFFWTGDSIGPAVYAVLDGSSNLGTASTNKSRGCSVRLVREATTGELILNDGDTSNTSVLDPYTGNDGTEYVTVKIDTQIWLAQNLRETQYNNLDNIFNAASNIPFGGDGSNATWTAKGTAQEGAWTAYVYGGNLLEYNPGIIEVIYTDVLENTLGQGVNWKSILDGTNIVYRAQLASSRSWYPTHIKVTPGYDVIDYDNSVPSITQKNLIVKRAVTGEVNIDFFPVKIDANGTLTIEQLNIGSTYSSVYLEILEYQPQYYSGSGIGTNNL